MLFSLLSILKVVTTTTMLGTLVQEVGGERVEVQVIVPGGMCPGHFDLKPGEVRAIEEAGLFLAHGWERWLEDLNVPEICTIKGNLMIPENMRNAVEKVSLLLEKKDPEGKDFYQRRKREFLRKIEKLEIWIDSLRSVFMGKKVVCSVYQKEFLSYLGFEVVATYGRPEDTGAGRLKELVDMIKKKKVELAVDNLQSGKLGEILERETGVKTCVLTNFPVNKGYCETVRENIKKLLNALTPGSNRKISGKKGS